MILLMSVFNLFLRLLVLYFIIIGSLWGEQESIETSESYEQCRKQRLTGLEINNKVKETQNKYIID